MQIEAEANRFAVELLMPADWLAEQFESARSVEEYFRTIQTVSGASRDAIFYKIFRSLNCPIICAQIDKHSRLLNGQHSQCAPILPARGDLIHDQTFGKDNHVEEFEIDGQRFLSWTFIGREITELDPRPWREIYFEILDETGMRSRLQSINGIVAAACGNNKSRSEPDICGAVFRALANYEQYSLLVNHPLIEQYLIKRVKEFKSRH